MIFTKKGPFSVDRLRVLVVSQMPLAKADAESENKRLQLMAEALGEGGFTVEHAMPLDRRSMTSAIASVPSNTDNMIIA
jgi:hypothetical protein